ncbi:MAG: hypothetical protein V7752_20385 [Halopseudomonas sp.]
MKLSSSEIKYVEKRKTLIPYWPLFGLVCGFPREHQVQGGLIRQFLLKNQWASFFGLAFNNVINHCHRGAVSGVLANLSVEY